MSQMMIAVLSGAHCTGFSLTLPAPDFATVRERSFNFRGSLLRAPAAMEAVVMSMASKATTARGKRGFMVSALILQQVGAWPESSCSPWQMAKAGAGIPPSISTASPPSPPLLLLLLLLPSLRSVYGTLR